MKGQQLAAEGYSFDLEPSIFLQNNIRFGQSHQRLTVFDQLRDIDPNKEVIVLVVFKRDAIAHHE